MNKLLASFGIGIGGGITLDHWDITSEMIDALFVGLALLTKALLGV